jgi:hypothetical protein
MVREIAEAEGLTPAETEQAVREAERYLVELRRRGRR